MGGNLPWNLVFAGAFIGIVVEVLGIPVLPFAAGLYLPIHLEHPDDDRWSGSSLP